AAAACQPPKDPFPMTTRLTILAPMFALLAAAGCNGPNDALTGTWTNSSCFGTATMPADIQTCSTSLAFSRDLDLVIRDVRQSQPATANYPRCTSTRTISGQQYSTSNNGGASGTLTLAGDSTSTLERAGCANDSDNSAPVAD